VDGWVGLLESGSIWVWSVRDLLTYPRRPFQKADDRLGCAPLAMPLSLSRPEISLAVSFQMSLRYILCDPMG
jgi:hypothetical protein